MKRAEAVTLLKQLSTLKIIDPIWVSMESESADFRLKIKDYQKTPELEKYCSDNNLRLEEQNGFLLISKP